ncbi:MAG: hypothetical protein ACXW11_03950 [Methylotenera sp.]
MLTNHALIASVDFVINWLKHALSRQHYRIRNDESLLAEMRQYLPYTLRETATNGIYILLNRQYQVLGSTDAASIPTAKYDDYTGAHIGLASAQVDSVCSNSQGLFSDVTAPWLNRKQAKAYLIRLQALHSILISNDRKIRQ